MSDPLPFSFRPDWSNPISERLSWLTTVMQSRSGAEQRYAVRLSPRRQFDIPLLLTGQERSYFDVILGRNGGGLWNVPIPHEEIPIGAISVGQTALIFDPTYREITTGTKLLLRDDWSRSEIVEVTVVSGTGVTITPTVLSYQAAYAVPTFLGIISDVVTAARHTARVYSATVRFTSQEPAFWPMNDREVSGLATADIGGKTFLILTQEPNAVNALDYTYERMWSTIDGDAALPLYIDKAARQFTTQKYEFFLVGPQERRNFRDLLYSLRGRQAPLWVPTFNDDLNINDGYPNPLGLSSLTPPGREYLVGFHRDGTVTFASTTDYLGVPAEDAYSDYDIYRKSFVSLKRLDVDDIEIQHHGGIDGVATCSVLFRDAPDLRDGFDDGMQTYPDAIFHYTGGDVTPTNDVGADSTTIADLIAEQTVETGAPI
jgi:hypothetical protein